MSYTLDKSKKFLKSFDKLDNNTQKKAITQISKIIKNPEIGKPMRYERKDTRELYCKPFRISYSFNKGELIILFIELYHKDKQ